MQDLTYEAISRLDDIGDIFEVAGRYDIPLDGCDSCEDFKERINLHKQKLNGHHKNILDHQRHLKLNRDTRQKREELSGIYQSANENLAGSLEFLTKILKSRGLSDDLSEDITRNVEALDKGECNIVIAGQTTAGKSALLNLLLGTDVLPKHILSCTSSICKLRYGQRFRVKFEDGENGVDETFNTHEETSEYLDRLVFEKELTRRVQGETIPEVEIELPADILKCGVTVIDTPGFGEHESMDRLVRNFITQSRVAAFVYVVKTDSAGGVQEDRLVRFLKSFLENNQGGEHQFNHRAALFVCNRWDLIDDSQKPEVKDSVVEKLKDVWPKLQESQICFFSTTKAKDSQAIDKEYITPDLHDLLTSLNSLFSLAHQDAIRKSYGWLKTILRESTVYMKTILSQIAMNEREQKEKQDIAKKQLGALQTKADDVIKDLKTIHEEATVALVEKFKEMLTSESFQEEVADWNACDVPPLPQDSNGFKDYKELIDSLIISKILKLFDNNEDCKDLVLRLKHKMLSRAKEQLKLLDKDMEEISSDLNGGSVRSSVSSNRSSVTEEEEIIMSVRTKRNGISSPKKTRPLFSRLIGPLISKAIDVISEQTIYRRTSQASPKHIMELRIIKVAKVLINDEDLLRKVASKYTDRLEHHIRGISWNIPMFIRANDTLIKESREFRNRAVRERHELKSAMEKLEPQREKLRGFGELHIKDFSASEIIFSFGDRRISSSTMYKVDTFLNRSHGNVGSRRDVVEGLWATVQKATLTGEDLADPVMVRHYIRQPSPNKLCKEIARIRCLEHRNIAIFLGMTHNDDLSSFVFDGYLTSARLYLRRSTVDLSKALPKFFNEVIGALEVLHKDGMVHMELTLDTLMVNGDGDVKLCNMCLPRTCKLPSDTATIDAADFTCLSPDVLKGGLYDSEADKYSYGLVLYEILMPSKPYEEQRKWKLLRFVNEVHPSTMLTFAEAKVPEAISRLLRSCLLRGKGLRMPIVSIREMLKIAFEDKSFHVVNLRDRISRRSRTLMQNGEQRHTLFRRRSRESSDEQEPTGSNSHKVLYSRVSNPHDPQ